MIDPKVEQFNQKAWGGNRLVKTTHPDNFPSKYFKYPKAFGYAYISFGIKGRLRAVFTFVPFNWIIRKVRDIYLYVKFGKSAEYAQMTYAKSAGFREGIETAIAITKQFDRLEEIKTHLNRCL